MVMMTAMQSVSGWLMSWQWLAQLAGSQLAPLRASTQWYRWDRSQPLLPSGGERTSRALSAGFYAFVLFYVDGML